MTQLPTLTAYPNPVPNKLTMDRETFANSVHTYLNFFNDTFVPETNNLITNLNILSNEIQTVANNAANSEQMAYKWAAQDINVEVANGKYSALHYALKAYGSEQKAFLWAESETEVEDGKYSAKWWANQAQSITSYIDDLHISANTTWSSQKIVNSIDSLLLTYKASPPIITIKTNILDEEVVSGTFDCEPDEDIVIFADSGEVININRTNKTFIYVPPKINTDTSTDTIHAYCTKAGFLRSNETSVQVTIHNVDIDDGLINNDFQSNEQDSSGIIYT